MGRGLAKAFPALCILVAFLLPGSLAPWSFGAPEGECGVWRWSVKTLSDSQVTDINFVPKARTISYLRRLRPPEELRSRTSRLGRVEFTTYRVRARLVEYKQEQDRDFHIVIADPRNTKRTMVAEVVDPTCPGARDSARADALQAMRQEFVTRFGQPTTSFKPVPGEPIVVLVGVGFWDSCTAGHIPKGAASNCIELHAVLDIEPSP